MAASQGLQDAFYRLFSDSYSIPNDDKYYSFERVDDNFSHYMEIPFNGINHVEYPIWAKSNIENRLESERLYSTIYTPLEKVIIPLYDRQTLGTVKTADSMLKKFFSINNRTRLHKAVNGDGTVYYGSRGVIFDKDFNMLACLCLTADWNQEEHNWRYSNSILRVSHWVFEHQQEFMAKAIIQKIIPLCLDEHTVYGNNFSFVGRVMDKCQIVIDDYSSVVVKPTKPSPNSCSDERLNQILVDNIDDIISLVQ